MKKIKKPVETYLTRNKLNLDNFTVIKNLEIDLFYKVFKTVYTVENLPKTHKNVDPYFDNYYNNITLGNLFKLKLQDTNIIVQTWVRNRFLFFFITAL